MATTNREKIKLVSSAGTGHYYTTAKNKKLQQELDGLRQQKEGLQGRLGTALVNSAPSRKTTRPSTGHGRAPR